MKKVIVISTKELVSTPKMMDHLFDMEMKGHIDLRVDGGQTTIITYGEGFKCLFCKEMGVYEDSEGYCVICGEDNLDVAHLVTK